MKRNPMSVVTLRNMKGVRLNLTMTVRLSGWLRVRFAIAIALLRLAAWVCGWGVDIQDERPDA